MQNGTELVKATEPRRYDGLMMATSPKEALRRVQELHAFVKEVMVPGTDYGPIPGTDRNVLLQAGAQKLAEIYGLAPRYEFIESRKDWDREFFYFEVRCILDSRRDGSQVGEGIGSCNSRESKYAYRWLYESELPAGTDKGALVQRTRESRKSGRPYTQYRVPNDDIASLVNTIMKMAMKRAHTAAVIGATRSAGIFDHDIDDLPEDVVGRAEQVRSWDQGDETPVAEQRATEIRRTETLEALSFVVEQVKADMTEGRLTRDEANELVTLARGHRVEMQRAQGGAATVVPAAAPQPVAVAAVAPPPQAPPPAAAAPPPQAQRASRPRRASGSADELFGPEAPAGQGVVEAAPAPAGMPPAATPPAVAPAAPAPAGTFISPAEQVNAWNAEHKRGDAVEWQPSTGPAVNTTLAGAAKVMGVFAVVEVQDPAPGSNRTCLAKLSELRPWTASRG